MSNYNIAINWSGKDALSDSDPDKVISGDDFHTEFTAVKTAVNTKAELNGSASESFSASTAAAGTNTTQVATTAFVKTAIDNAEAWPVGSVFISVVSTDPATLLGYGTWVAFATGKTLVGIDAADTDFDVVEETGGAKTHTLTVDEMPSHTHDLSENKYHDTGASGSSGSWTGDWDNANTTKVTATATGGGQAHNNLQPYIVTYMWKRTA